VVDPGGRDGCRAPIPWTAEPDHGWGVTDPWLPWPPDADHRNVESLRADPGSILHLYRRLLAERKASPALQVGHQVLLDAPLGVVAWDRTNGADRRRVLVNFTDVLVSVGDVTDRADQPGSRTGDWIVAVASDGVGEEAPFGGDLGAEQALVLRPG